MILTINDEYRLAADSRGWMIEQKCVLRDNGETDWTPIGRFSTLAEAVEGYAVFRTQDVIDALEEAKTIAAELCEALQAIPNLIDELLTLQANTRRETN